MIRLALVHTRGRELLEIQCGRGLVVQQRAGVYFRGSGAVEKNEQRECRV